MTVFSFSVGFDINGKPPDGYRFMLKQEHPDGKGGMVEGHVSEAQHCVLFPQVGTRYILYVEKVT